MLVWCSLSGWERSLLFDGLRLRHAVALANSIQQRLTVLQDRISFGVPSFGSVTGKATGWIGTASPYTPGGRSEVMRTNAQWRYRKEDLKIKSLLFFIV